MVLLERFINHTFFNLIPKYVLIKVPKKKTILTTPLGTEPKSLRDTLIGNKLKQKVLNTSIQFMQKAENFSFFVIHKHTVKHMIILHVPKLL